MLIILGADIHAIANNNMMPINLAQQAAYEAEQLEQVTACGEMVKYLKKNPEYNTTIAIFLAHHRGHEFST